MASKDLHYCLESYALICRTASMHEASSMFISNGVEAESWHSMASSAIRCLQRGYSTPSLANNGTGHWAWLQFDCLQKPVIPHGTERYVGQDHHLSRASGAASRQTLRRCLTAPSLSEHKTRSLVHFLNKVWVRASDHCLALKGRRAVASYEWPDSSAG
jgi:hypothetical protein